MKYTLLLLAIFLPLISFAQQPVQFRVEVLDVLETREEVLPGIDQTSVIQTLRVEALSGEDAGEVFEIENDFFKSKVGDTFFVSQIQNGIGETVYAVGEPDRRGVLLIFVMLAAGAIILLGGFHGVRALAALFISGGIIIFGMVPLLLQGYPPLLVGSGIAILILATVMGLTHGISKTTFAAFLGTAGAVVVAGVLASLAIQLAKISGFATDEAVFLNILTDGTLNLSGIFLAAVIIGMIGVLDDVAVTQAATVRELLASGCSKKDALTRSMRIGREHVGALVNTLALAYAGASLPLLLVFAYSTATFDLIINREIFAAEVIRTAVGTIGIVLAVPLTTLIALFFLTGKEKDTHGHTHSHG